MEAVKSGVGINRAVMECGVPHTTLKDHISGRVEHGVNSGPVTLNSLLCFVNSLICDSPSASGDSESSGRGTTITTGSKPPEFTDEQEQLYQKRYDKRYNLTVDSEYLRWLKFHHPESSLLSDSLSESKEEDMSLSAYVFL